MNFTDIELLSAYLDGQSSPSDSSRLEARLKSDPELAATLQALRESRGLLRQLPKRRAPRSFTLTPSMVGKKPPLPRSYPIFRFATALAALLFIFSYTANRVSQMAASSAPVAYGIGGGGGGDGGEATEAPMMQSMPAATMPPATEAPVEPSLEAALLPTATPEIAADQNRTTGNPPSAKQPGGAPPLPAPAPQPFQIPSTWIIAFGLLALLGVASMFLIQRLAAKKWRGK